MIAASKYFAVVALLAACAANAEAGALPSGVCYSPWHHGSVDDGVVQKDLGQIKQYFSSFRTYHAKFGGVNVVDAAAKAGLKVAVGVMMKDKGKISDEISAVCDGAKRNPGVIQAVYVGNENLQNGEHGDCSAGELIELINKVKGCTSGSGIKVGTVQRINEWLSAPEAAKVIAASDSIGVNIYPFFTPGEKKPIEKLEEQWKQITDKVPGDKVALTETGWPRQGSPSPQKNAPSKETAQQFFNDYAKWSESHIQSYYFMMYDSTNAYGGGDYEKSFGLFDKDAQQQIQIPGGSGPAPEPKPTPPATPEPKPTPPTTPAPGPQPNPAPGPGPAPSSQPTPAPTTQSPKPNPAPGPQPNPAPGPGPAPGPQPTQTPMPNPGQQKPITTPVATAATPKPTPAQSKPGKHCT